MPTLDQQLNAHVVARVAEAFDVGTVHSIGYLAAGLMNRNWRLTTDRGSYALKQIIDVPVATAQRNLRVLTALHQAGVPTCPPVLTSGGEPVVMIDDSGYCALPWHDGTHPHGPDLTLTQTRHLGVVVGQIHDALNHVDPDLRLAPATTRPAGHVTAPQDAIAEARRYQVAAKAAGGPFDTAVVELLDHRIALIDQHVADRPTTDHITGPYGWTHGDLQAPKHHLARRPNQRRHRLGSHPPLRRRDHPDRHHPIRHPTRTRPRTHRSVRGRLPHRRAHRRRCPHRRPPPTVVETHVQRGTSSTTTTATITDATTCSSPARLCCIGGPRTQRTSGTPSLSAHDRDSATLSTKTRSCCRGEYGHRTGSRSTAPGGTPMPAGDLDRLVQRAHAAAASVETVLHHTDKAVVAVGQYRGRPVVIKLLTTTDPYWRLRRRHEVEVYRQFQTHPPPVRAPRLIYDDGDSLMLLTQLPGTRLHDHRHLDTELGTATVTAVLDALNLVPAWKPATALAAVIADYQGRIDAERAGGLLDAPTHAAISHLLARCATSREVQHGDPLPANLLMDGHKCGLVDWEHAGLYLPGWDLAVLDTVAGTASPTLRAAIESTIAEHQIWDAYRVNLALVVAREIRIHRCLPITDPLRADRLAALDTAWRRVNHFLRRDPT